MEKKSKTKFKQTKIGKSPERAVASEEWREVALEELLPR